VTTITERMDCATRRSPEGKTMVSEDKEFEYVTSQIVKHVQRSVDAFKLFTQLFSAIVGGSIWLSTQRNVSPAAAKTYSHLSGWLVVLVTVIASVMIIDNYRVWYGFRLAQSRLVPTVPPPKLKSTMTAALMVLCIEVDPGFWTCGLGGADAVPF
jgi:hypothetical protein